jgi:DNA-binding NtrC family response regulator
MSRIDLLIVDEDAEFRELLVRRFERTGFAVESTSSGEVALQLAQHRHFDAAIFEQQLPGMSGLELLEEFETNHPECAVVFLTGYDCYDAGLRAMQAGAFQYLLKPCSLVEVERQVREAVQSRWLQKMKSAAIVEDSPGDGIAEQPVPLPAA